MHCSIYTLVSNLQYTLVDFWKIYFSTNVEYTLVMAPDFYLMTNGEPLIGYPTPIQKTNYCIYYCCPECYNEKLILQIIKVSKWTLVVATSSSF